VKVWAGRSSDFSKRRVSIVLELKKVRYICIMSLLYLWLDEIGSNFFYQPFMGAQALRG